MAETTREQTDLGKTKNGQRQEPEPSRDAMGLKPGWLARYCAACRAFADLEKGWNSYDAEPPSREMVERGVALLILAVQLGYVPVTVGPDADGGLWISFGGDSSHVVLCTANEEGEDIVASRRDNDAIDVRAFEGVGEHAMTAALRFACDPATTDAAAASVVLAVDPSWSTPTETTHD